MVDGQGRVVIRREVGFWRDRLRRYKVHIDGKMVARLGEGEEAVWDVPPGRHEVQVKLDWGTSPKLALDLAACEVARLRCGPGSMLGILIPGQYLVLEGDGFSTRLGHTDVQRDLQDSPWDDDLDKPWIVEPE